MAIDLNCPHCKQLLPLDDLAAGKLARCPGCGKTVNVPVAGTPIPTDGAANAVLFCTKCGQKNAENNYQCAACGFVLHGPQKPRFVAQDDSTLGGLIPVNNTQALTAYYCGVFSLIPCLGIPLGIAGLVLGLRGLKHAGAHPESKGVAHAWVGIILGGICALVNIVLLAVMLLNP